jgi:hypothetical protein
MDSKQSENNCISSLIKLENMVLQARNINVAKATSLEVVDRKFKLLSFVLDDVRNFIECSGYSQLLMLILDAVSNFGYEIAYNRTFETQSQLLHRIIVLRLSEIAETSLKEVELSPFLKEKSLYIWKEPERSLLLNRIKDIENQAGASF